MAERGYVIRGRVQGVGFRWWTRRTASGLGIVGTVMNRPDGSVHVAARGGDDALTRLADRLRKGPPMSRVDEVVEVTVELPGELSAFTIEEL